MSFTRKYLPGFSSQNIKIFALVSGTALLTLLGACKKETPKKIDINDYTGKYIGIYMIYTPMPDSSGAVSYQTITRKDSAIVTLDSLVENGLVISGAGLGSPYSVVITDEYRFSTGTNSQSLNGHFTGDSLHYDKRCGLPCNSWFDGKKQ